MNNPHIPIYPTINNNLQHILDMNVGHDQSKRWITKTEKLVEFTGVNKDMPPKVLNT
ncbi:MAG: hypothetical protein WAZ77_10885 [Candidatus Nitrosopolaris sp.]